MFYFRMKRDGHTSGSYSNHEIVTIEKIERQGSREGVLCGGRWEFLAGNEF